MYIFPNYTFFIDNPKHQINKIFMNIFNLFFIIIYKILIGVIYMKLYVTDKWKIIRYTTIVFAICFVFTLANNIPLDVIQTFAVGKLLPIYNIETTDKVLSLTFDLAQVWCQIVHNTL